MVDVLFSKFNSNDFFSTWHSSKNPPKLNPIVRKTRRAGASGFGGKAGLSPGAGDKPCFSNHNKTYHLKP